MLYVFGVSASDLDLAEDLRAAIGDFVRQVRVHDRMPANQAAVLGHLDRGGSLSIADLARLEQMKHQSMTRTVHLLEGRDLLELAPHPQDRRQHQAAITAHGRAALAAERSHRAAGIAQSLRTALTEEERETVRRLPEILRKLQP